MSTEIDDIKDIGEEEYIIMNLDSRQMETDGTHWFVKNMKGERGFDEPIPYVTSIELVDSYIPNTFYNVEEYNNVFAFGTLLEHYILNDSNVTKGPTTYTVTDSLYEIPLHSSNPDDNPVPDQIYSREYVKLNNINPKKHPIQMYIIRHTISKIINGFMIQIMKNTSNTSVSTLTQFFIQVTDATGNEIKRGIIDTDTPTCDITVGKMIKNDLGEWVKPPGTFDMYAVEDDDDVIDDIPSNTHVRVFSYMRVEYPIQNYTSEELMETTNAYIKTHLRDIFDPIKNEIVSVMPYDTFLDLHLKLEKNDKSKRFTFTSLHDHPFFIDLTESRSITQELGFSHKLYTSVGKETKYTQKMASSDDISSITRTELRAIPSAGGGSGNNTTIYQAFNRLFFSDTSEYFIRENQRNIEAIFVNDYPFKTGIFDTYRSVTGTLLSVYTLLLLQADSYFILPFKPSFFNIFVKMTTNVQKTDENGDPYYDISTLLTTDPEFYDDRYGDLYNDKTFVESFVYTIDTQVIESENIINLSGERYVDLVCVEIQNELKRYNAGYNKLYRYYFDDVSDLYVTSTKGNVTDLVLRNPRDFGPMSRLNKLTIQFIRSDGNPYDFKTIPFFITIAIKYLKPVLRTEEVES